MYSVQGKHVPVATQYYGAITIYSFPLPWILFKNMLCITWRSTRMCLLLLILLLGKLLLQNMPLHCQEITIPSNGSLNAVEHLETLLVQLSGAVNLNSWNLQGCVYVSNKSAFKSKVSWFSLEVWRRGSRINHWWCSVENWSTLSDYDNRNTQVCNPSIKSMVTDFDTGLCYTMDQM